MQLNVLNGFGKPLKMTKTIEPFEAWHFLSEDRRLRYEDKTLVTPGLKLSVDDTKLELCEYGLHASKRAIDALQYAPGPIICRVRVSGKILEDGDKVCAAEREVIWMADATGELHEFGCWAAEQALYLMRSKGDEPDKRSWAAIEAKRAWLRGEITDQDLDAARAAAWDAARAAAWAAAGDAARTAAWDAARTAAWDAARAAAGAAARAAAWAAAWDAQNDQLESMLNSIMKRIE
jgi:hypothetical protein